MILTTKTSDGLHQVQIYGQSADQVILSPVFQNWLDGFDHEKMELRVVLIQSADLFLGGKVLFVKMETDAVDRATGQAIPGIVFLRGNAVAILTVAVCEETHEHFIVVTKQPRVPLGLYRFYETPAGMIDKKDGVIGRAIAEMKEETGLEVEVKDLIPLGFWVPSAGGCDEKIGSYLLVKRLSQAKIEAMRSETFGVQEEYESITLELWTVDEMLDHIAKDPVVDAKLLASLFLLLAKHVPDVIRNVLSNL